MVRRLRRVFLFCGLSCVALVMVLMLLETTLMYPAPPKSDGDWQAHWLDHEDVYFQSADGTQLHGWYCEHPQPQHTILFCHGNGEHVAYLADELAFLRDTLQANVLAFDYRGYGKSSGKPFEAGILADGAAAQLWLAKRTGQAPQHIVLWGRSLGGAVAVGLAAEHGARSLVLDRTFSSMVEVAGSHFPWLPIRWLLRNRYPSSEWITRYRGPVFQVHGRLDEIVPLRYGQALFEAAPGENKRVVISETLTHNATWPDDYYVQLVAFLSELPELP